jgi:hypothetical protein
VSRQVGIYNEELVFRLISLDVNIPQIAANSGSIAGAMLAVLLSRGERSATMRAAKGCGPSVQC